jgi:hypothetical protein
VSARRREGAPGLGHQPESVKAWAVAAAATGVIALVVVVGLAIHPMFARLHDAARDEGGPAVQLSERAQRELAATRHWAEPPVDIGELHARERAHLEGYGWVDHAHGIVHIPIDRAMEEIAAEGWLDSTSSGPPATRGTGSR